MGNFFCNFVLFNYTINNLVNPDVWFPLNGFVFAGAGFSREMLGTYDQLESRFLKMYTAAVVHAGCGVRLSIYDMIRSDRDSRLAAEIRINIRYTFAKNLLYSNPDLLLSWGLVFSDK